MGGLQLRQALSRAMDGKLSLLLFMIEEGKNVNTARQILIFISGWTLDAVLVYRVYVLFGRSIIISAIPGSCLVGTVSTFSHYHLYLAVC
jgi:hypothetical protein